MSRYYKSIINIKIDINETQKYKIRQSTNMVYTLQDVLSITFDGFDFNIPDETIQLIQELSSQVGSPTYIKTPNFQKKEVGVNAAASTSSATQSKKNKRSNKAVEVVNDSDWENLRAFHATKIEQKIGVDAEIDMIRNCI